MDYKELLAIFPSRKYVEDENGNEGYANIYLLDQLLWFSRIWERVTMVRSNIKVESQSL